MNRGFPNYEIVLLDSANRTVLLTGKLRHEEHGIERLQATIPVNSPLLDGGQGNLVVSINNHDYQNIVRHDWWLWTLHFAVTLGVVFSFLSIAIYFQVTKPISRLVLIVKKMERGYWGLIDIAGGAWEIRWLTWRFSNMIQEMQRTMMQLLEAQQKARSPAPSDSHGHKITDQEQQQGLIDVTPDHADDPVYHRLLAVCRQLEAMSPNDPKAEPRGREVWQREAMEANRLGFHEIKARLENAALRLMEPDDYNALSDDLGELIATRQDWTKQCGDDLYHLLETAAIPCAGVRHRVKHTAGVWQKMQSKELNINEIHDLFAFRIIVPKKADCYGALGVIHDAYQPLITRFKDYIAEPKENGYKSLHTCVIAYDGPVFEIQIRSMIMDRESEHGSAAHWVYKENTRETRSKSVLKRWVLSILRRSGTSSAL